MTILVTGAAGFIGSKVCELLLAEGHIVVGIDNLNDFYDTRLKDYRLSRLLGHTNWTSGADSTTSIYAGQGRLMARKPLASFIFNQVDIEDITALQRLFEEFSFDIVYNIAGRAGVRYSMENPHIYLTTNTHGTLNLLECQRQRGVQKHILASTSSLYAGCKMPWTEEMPVNAPLSPYAASKKAAELMAHSYHKLYGLDITVLRYFTVFGPAGRPDMSIFRFIKWIDEGRPLELFGDGSQSRDFTYVDDIARGTILAAKPLGYEIINLGGGRNPISLREVIAFIEAALGKKANVLQQEFHVADSRDSWADISKADRLLGWKPCITPQEGFRHAVDWYMTNRSWLAEVKL